MADEIDGRSRLYFPNLARFYAIAVPLGYVVMRVCLGLVLVPHGMGKLFGTDIPHTAQNFVKLGWPAPLAWAWLVGCIEFFGGLMLALGLFTRIVAAMIAIEMAVISFLVLWPAWGWAHHGMEYAFMMGVFAFGMALRGGGAYSLDRWLGKEV
ncbi:MAG TPA: DoxX family protein [Stellaceae bacterium]|nr:DoxX family protein [Stellaceae bacterium]